MSPRQPQEELAQERRMEIYQALADDQDLYEFTPEQARKHVADRFGIPLATLNEIEREGRERLWPPF